MSKRPPEVQLTKDNYDQQDSDNDVEEVTESRIAPPEVLKNRAMVKAKRRITDVISEGNGNVSATSNIFSGFKSFSNATLGGFNTSKSPFVMPSITNFKTTTIVENTTSTTNDTNKPLNNGDVDIESKNELKSNDNAIRNLNNAFFNHIKKFIDSDQVYDFTVVCTEYISQIKNLTMKNKPAATIENKNVLSSKTDDDNKQEKFNDTFKFGSNAPQSDSTFKLPQSTFSFGQNTNSSFGSTTQSKPQFNFGSINSSIFGANPTTSTPFTKFNIPQTSSEENNTETKEEGADEDAPPKVVSVEHNEEGAVYTKKCKLFYQKDGSYVDKGVGFLYIKTIKDSKPQLLIRSATTTGNILLNISLVETLPVKLAEKGKGVMLTCIPNPEIEPKKKDEHERDTKQSVTFLIRVKATDCDELYNSIVKYKSP